MTDLLAPPTLPPVHPLHAPPAPPTVAKPAPEWRIVWRGRTFCEVDLTGQHLSTLALLTGTDSYDSLDLDPRHGHQRLMQMICAFVAVESAETAEPDEVPGRMATAIEQVSKASADEILAALRFD